MNILWFFGSFALAGVSDNVGAQPEPCSFEIRGPTDTRMLNEIEQIECRRPELTIASIGGEGWVGLTIARSVRAKHAKIVVDEHCLSSCAEFLLAGAAKVQFQDEPLIGFHGNPAMKEWLAKSLGANGREHCSFDEASTMYDLYFEADLNYGFWQKQLDFLELEHFAVSPNPPPGECPAMGFKFKHEMWFPDSATLRNDLGLSFSGKVCADDFERCAARIGKLFPGRGTFVVGDRVVDTRNPKD